MSLLIYFTLSLAHAQMAQDSNYAGSSYNEVVSVLESSPPEMPEEFEAYGPGGVSDGRPLVHYPVDFASMGGLFTNYLEGRSKQTLVERADYYPYFKKFVHANGICVVGTWRARNDLAYGGFFANGAEAKFIGRISVALNETTYMTNGNINSRGFGFAGKLFPTTNPDAKVPTTSFFTVDVLSGTPAPTFLGSRLTNDPPLIASWGLAGVLAKIVPAFMKADSSPSFRPVTQLAAGGAAPIWMRLKPAAGTVVNQENDFRTEIERALADNGKLEFEVDTSRTVSDRNVDEGWQPTGKIVIDRAIISFGCDRRLHFSHPKDDHSKPKEGA